MTANDELDEDKCPYCLCDLDPGQLVVVCPDCGLAHHNDCWAENEGCCTFGCTLAPLRSSIAAPVAPSQRGSSEAPRGRCPNCGRFLPLGAVACPHCRVTAHRPLGLGPSIRQVARRSLGLGAAAIVCALVACNLLWGALPAVVAGTPVLLLLCAPGAILAVHAIRNGQKAMELGAGQVEGVRGRAGFGIFLGVLGLVLTAVTFFGAVARVLR